MSLLLFIAQRYSQLQKSSTVGAATANKHAQTPANVKEVLFSASNSYRTP